ncbi:MAG: thiolase family protein [Deltaproteobacteria bacterium]|nr:thiolase family protein [Deltaproteobacteria bacterium]MCX7952283.1 thiolase family protein [Deltaproteobacteria bacterium]
MGKSIVICWGKRTPIGSYGGYFKDISAIELASVVLKQLGEDIPQARTRASDIIVGNVLSAGLGQAPAKQILIRAGFPPSIQAQLVNKVCSSSLEALRIGYNLIKAGSADCVILCGTESMSKAPHLLNGLRFGIKFGKSELLDHMLYDGLTNPYDMQLMGQCCEKGARMHRISRDEQDEYAILSYKRAQDSNINNYFADEIVLVDVNGIEIRQDEIPFKADFEKLKTLKPAFEKNGTITAGNASSLADGACVALLATYEVCKELGADPIAELVAFGRGATTPEEFYSAPVLAIRDCCEKANIKSRNIKIFEVNEAFSLVPLLAQKALDLPLDILNVRGGAVSLGHPIGMSGLRIVITLMNIMKDYNLETGIASICNGGGEAVSVLLRLAR